jgi:hypothetical protein
MRGSRHDYTAGPLGQAILLLAIPMVMEMIMESVFAVADVFWVAHLGADAVATVGLTESLLTLIYTAAMGLSIGVTAMVARRVGEGTPAAAAEAAWAYGSARACSRRWVLHPRSWPWGRATPGSCSAAVSRSRSSSS